MAKKQSASTKTTKKAASKKRKPTKSAGSAKYPRHSILKALRVPRVILDQNAGKPCTQAEAAAYLKIGATGPFGVEVSSASKYGLLQRLDDGRIQPTETAKAIIRPQSEHDERNGLRKAVLGAPQIGDIYQHYRGENLPDDEFFKHAVVDMFGVPDEKYSEFKQIFFESLKAAELLAQHGEKYRVVDVTEEIKPTDDDKTHIAKLGKSVSVLATDICFVMQPFAPPLGDYYEKIYKPAIEKSGLKPQRADAEIFGTGKVMDQVWRGIHSARVLLAELTSRNPNVFYELGLAHALRKPVVLVSATDEDVPFDLRHIRVIYYDRTDPFWGQKLLDKVAENILSALQNPEEAIFRSTDD